MSRADTVIVVYIPAKGPFLSQFLGLYYSVVCKTQLYKRFEFLVAGSPIIESKIPKKYCTFVPVEELSKQSRYRYIYSNNPYGYVDSFAPFVHDKCIDVIKQYNYCLRLDVDTFLCNGIESIIPNENEIYVGNAGYSSETARVKLSEIISNMNLPDQNIHNIGSTWYTTSDNMIKYGSKTIDYVEYFLKEEFDKHEGKWPQWYAGVILLYSGHIAINSSSLDINKTMKFDAGSTQDTPADDYYSLHCWHTDNFFSKHWYMNNRYKDRKPDSKSKKCNEYSYDCIFQGNRLWG